MSFPVMKFAILLVFVNQIDTSLAKEPRNSKVLPVFQVVRFPNDVCISSGAKNGTCYTTEECSSKGGVNAGSCASGFGVCCTFTIGCGASSNENCTFFESSAAPDGGCAASICKLNDNICQIRLDFDEFVLTGPSTSTVSVSKQTGGVAIAAGKEFSFASNCRTDIFAISGAPAVPVLCGTLTGEHLYFEATNECHDLNFSIGQSGIGVTKVATRKFIIKVSQLTCTSGYLAPSGCLQYRTGSTGVVKSFNFDQSQHLANQHQTICFRREQGNCRICYSAEAKTDIQLGGKHTKAVTKHSSCCGYGSDGAKSTGGFDCLIVPGASKASDSKHLNIGWCQAGGTGGLTSVAAGTTSVTLCSKNEPYRLEFISDGLEFAVSATVEGPTKGFKLTWFQTSC